MAIPGESAEERRARKAAEREANHARLGAEIRALLNPLAPGMALADCIALHGLLRSKIVEMQQLVITGRFDPKLEAQLERQLVEQIHAVEAIAHALSQEAGALPSEKDRTVR
ncbi:MAG: hypothetical protein ACYDDF_06715 [Thermoplasmatota archaeon]